MADVKISALTALTGANVASNDVLPIVDTSATATKSITAAELKTYIAGAPLTLASGTITDPSTALTITQTWNDAADTFNALKVNVTNTASAAASTLMDLQVAGTSQFSVRNDGRTTISGPSSEASYIIGTAPFRTGSLLIGLQHGAGGSGCSFGNDAGSAYGGCGVYGFITSAGLYYGFTSGSLASAPDLLLKRRAAASLQLGAEDAAAPVAQTLSVQSVVTGTTNTAGTDFTIAGSQGTGTGAGGSIIFQVAPVGSSGSAVNALQTAMTIDAGATITAVGSLRTPYLVIMSGASQHAYFQTAGQGHIRMFDGTGSDLNSIGLGNDLILARDAAATLALRNGTAAQTLRTYGTYTDASNYRRVALSMTTAGVATLLPEGAGTGSSGNVIHISGLPTSNPGPGILWNNAGTPAIGT